MICEWKIFSRLLFFFGRKKDEGKKIKEKKKTSKKAQQRCHGIIVHYASNWAVMNYQRNNCTIDHNGLIVSTSLPFTYFFNQWKLSTKMNLWVSILISPLWLGVGWGLGSPCRLRGSSPDLFVAGLVGRHWKGFGGAQTTMLLGLEGASPCLAGLWQGQQWEALVLSRSWHGLTSNHLQEHRLLLSHSCLSFWSQPFVMLANIYTRKALHSKEKTSHSSGLTSEPLTHHHWSPHLILLRLLPLRVWLL